MVHIAPTLAGLGEIVDNENIVRADLSDRWLGNDDDPEIGSDGELPMFFGESSDEDEEENIQVWESSSESESTDGEESEDEGNNAAE